MSDPCIKRFWQYPKAHIFVVIDTQASYISLNTAHKLDQL